MTAVCFWHHGGNSLTVCSNSSESTGDAALYSAVSTCPGNYAAVEREVRRLLPFEVHTHSPPPQRHVMISPDATRRAPWQTHDDGSWGPLFVRLAWHAAGTFDPHANVTGGTNGATMRFEPESSDGANNGLGLARDRLEGVKRTHPWISYGDLWTLAAVVAIKEMGGPDVPWRPGRVDAVHGDPVPPNGRLPDARKDAFHVRQVFNERMGFTDEGWPTHHSV